MVLIAAFLVLLYKKKALEKETDLRLARQYIDGLESERKRLAKELHDGVCNDLLGIQYYMQTSDAIGKEVQQKLFPMIEQTRTDVRFISHELMPPAFQYANLNGDVGGLCRAARQCTPAYSLSLFFFAGASKLGTCFLSKSI